MDFTQAHQESPPPQEPEQEAPLARPEPAKPAEAAGGFEEPATDDETPGEAALAEAAAFEAAAAAKYAAPEDAVGSAAAPGDSGEAPDTDERTLEELERQVATLLFASPEPLGEGRLAELLQIPGRRVREALAALDARFAASGLPYHLREIAGGWQIFTSPEMADTVALLARVRKEEKVSPAALETLAVVAYRQPVTKAEIEAIRGVQVGPILRSLAERGLVRVAGRSDQPGHPLLYGTTRKFLDSFGLPSLDELPRDGELLRD